MYEKNGIVTSPVVDANNVSIGTSKTLLSRKEVNVEAIFSFVRRCLQALFLSEVVWSLYNWERLFRSEREPRSCRGWTESLVADDRNPTKPLTRCWTSRCSTAALFRSSLAFCESSRRNLRQRPTGEEAANPSPQSRSLSKSITGGEDSSWRWRLGRSSSWHDAMDSAETCGRQRKRSEPVDSVASGRRCRRRRRRSPPEAASRVAMVGDSFSVLVM